MQNKRPGSPSSDSGDARAKRIRLDPSDNGAAPTHPLSTTTSSSSSSSSSSVSSSGRTSEFKSPTAIAPPSGMNFPKARNLTKWVEVKAIETNELRQCLSDLYRQDSQYDYVSSNSSVMNQVQKDKVRKELEKLNARIAKNRVTAAQAVKEPTQEWTMLGSIGKLLPFELSFNSAGIFSSHPDVASSSQGVSLEIDTSSFLDSVRASSSAAVNGNVQSEKKESADSLDEFDGFDGFELDNQDGDSSNAASISSSSTASSSSASSSSSAQIYRLTVTGHQASSSKNIIQQKIDLSVLSSASEEAPSLDADREFDAKRSWSASEDEQMKAFQLSRKEVGKCIPESLPLRLFNEPSHKESPPPRVPDLSVLDMDPLPPEFKF